MRCLFSWCGLNFGGLVAFFLILVWVRPPNLDSCALASLLPTRSRGASKHAWEESVPLLSMRPHPWTGKSTEKRIRHLRDGSDEPPVGKWLAGACRALFPPWYSWKKDCTTQLRNHFRWSVGTLHPVHVLTLRRPTRGRDSYTDILYSSSSSAFPSPFPSPSPSFPSPYPRPFLPWPKSIANLGTYISGQAR